MNALQLTAALIDQIILPPGEDPSSYPKMVACEIPFAGHRRKVDVCTITSNGELAAYEVKSENDSLSRLAGQLEDYEKCFDLTYLVLNERHLHQVRSLVGVKIGIIVEKKGKLSIVRAARKRARINKEYLVSLLPKHAIYAALSKSPHRLRDLDTHEWRQVACKKLRLIELKSIVNAHLERSFGERLRIFMAEKSEPTHIDDLLALSRRSPTKVTTDRHE